MIVGTISVTCPTISSDMSSSVPVIDFTAGQTVPIDGKWNITPDQELLAVEIIEAFKTVGFLCLVNTELNQTTVRCFLLRSELFLNLMLQLTMSNVLAVETIKFTLQATCRKHICCKSIILKKHSMHFL